MSDGSSVTYQISVSELDKLLDLCQKAVDGLSAATKMTKANRERVRSAVGDTCELIDTILTTVKQRLSDIHKALLVGDSSAAPMIADLGNASEWEANYRRFHLCEPLRNAAGELRHGVLGQLVSYFSFKNPDELKTTIEAFLSAEEAAGRFVSQLLDRLTPLANEVGNDPQMVDREIQNARQQVQHYRDEFIALEKQIRATV